MKRLAGFILLVGMIFSLKAVSHAENRLSFEYNGRAFTIEQASYPKSGFPFELLAKEGVLLLSDKASGLSASIRLDSLDEAALEALRKYYNDQSSIDYEMFTKYIDLQKSYIPALQDLYRNSYLFGDSGNSYAESNMKVFYQDKNKIFGNNSDVFLYNIISSDRLDYLEETHLDLIIPVYSDLSLLSINFTFKAGNLNSEAEQAVYRLLGGIRFPGFPVQTGQIKVFGEKEAIMAANAGIYSTAEGNADTCVELKNEEAGYSLEYPSSYLPYMENRLGVKLNYVSFKASPDQIFSVSAEQVSVTDSVYDKPSYIKEFYRDAITVKKEGTATMDGKEFVFLNYELEDTDGYITYVRDYYTSGGGFIYNLRFSSRFMAAPEESDSQFDRILGSLTLDSAGTEGAKSDVPFRRYSNKEEGYSFLYPVKWNLTDLSRDINFDSLYLKIPELSGPIDISISEGELKKGIGSGAIPSILAGTDTDAYEKSISNYTAPYAGAEKRLLSNSVKKENGITYVYRLVNYLDPNGRMRLCYSMDIVKKSKVYSMFISVSEYATSNGSVSDLNINAIIDTIASSFKSDETYESHERDSFGETRNRKVVLLESILRKQLGPDAKITQAVNSKAGGSYYLLVEDIADSGYYRVKPDFSNNTLLIEERLLVKDCKSFLKGYLSTDAEVYFASGDQLKALENFRTGNGHYTMVVYAEFGNQSGFLLLEADPQQPMINVISFKSSSNLAEEISAGIAQNAEVGFIIGHSIDKRDFTMNFHFYSSVKGHFFKSYQILCNPETLRLKYDEV